MKYVDQNRTIAVICGWEISGTSPSGEPYGFPASAICRSSMAYETIPNYVSDLNAMQEAEDNLTGEERQRYIEQLVFRQHIWIDENKACAFAIAPQRAECFLRVKGKWVQG